MTVKFVIMIMLKTFHNRWSGAFNEADAVFIELLDHHL